MKLISGYSIYFIGMRLKVNWYMRAFNNYVDKIRGGGGQKMSVFVHAQGIRTVHAGWGWGVKKRQNYVHVVVE